MPEIDTTHNQFAYSVSEIAFALKKTVEEQFGYVRIRGEVSGWRGAHSSGHAYFRLKDDKAVLEAVCWKGTLGKVGCKPEEGLEVIATGRLTTYPGSSKYQIVIERMEPAGVGALMALLEKRKAQFAAEGLFAPERKKPLPFMPRVIGVITSPTGAVIRDILHRLSDRFPTHVIVWPVRVQGETAAQEIADAITGFHSFSIRPDLLIVARGGGSLEDLWSFNEEVVVRAAANATIPLISAVGHETDTTLIDFVSDMRAPTPTAAAEMAVPVLSEWRHTIGEHGQRLALSMQRNLQSRQERMEGFARALLHPRRLIEQATQRLDDWSERHSVSLRTLIQHKTQMLAVLLAKLQPQGLLQIMQRQAKDIVGYQERLQRLVLRGVQEREQKLATLAQFFESLNPTRILERGFVLVRGTDGKLISRAAEVKPGELTLTFHDGARKVKA